uniref:V-type proton ATPase subunit E n=1 Tax=Panagrellus redivivus TaxID=6233 RepID=A0A7E4ZVB8_PANRE
MSFIRAENIDDMIELENVSLPMSAAVLDDPVASLLAPMMRHIAAEAADKADEIDLRATEELKIEKRRIFEEQKAKINDYYTRKRAQVDTAHKVFTSNRHNESRIAALKSRDKLLQEVLNEAREDLNIISSDKNRYPHILKGLILQGVLQMLEPKLILRCRKEDVELINSLLESVQSEQEKLCGFISKFEIDDTFLADKIAGGVELYAKGGKISVSSTLESRMGLIAQQIVPQIRTALFGPNENRAFFD